VSVALHPGGDPFSDLVTVQVLCDKPDCPEIITALMPDEWTTASETSNLHAQG
jgi:hypothetical protein